MVRAWRAPRSHWLCRSVYACTLAPQARAAVSLVI